MSDAHEPIVIRSYRRVFNVERKIYRVDKWTIPIPGGVPLRAVIYFIAAELALLLLSHLPLLSLPLGLIPWQYKYVVIPLGIAVLGTQVTPDGRPAHRYVGSLVGYLLRRHRLAGGHAAPLEGEAVPYQPDTWITPDSQTPTLRRARVKGPATVHFREQVVADPPTTARRFTRRRRVRPQQRGRRLNKRQEITDSVAVKPDETVEITP